MPLDVPTLAGRHVRLEPLAEPHREPLRPAAEDPRIWENMLIDGSGAGFDLWFDATLADRTSGAKFPFAVRLAGGSLVGSTSYIDFHPKHKRVEIGATWYHPSAWATAVNPECKLLLLTHAFEVLGVNRVSLVTDARNARSQAAIAKLGADREGVLRSHMVTRGGRVRDSVVFGIVAADWPRVKAGLRARVGEG
jgi:RimJ/RimL family protein N-acetyltransferase